MMRSSDAAYYPVSAQKFTNAAEAKIGASGRFRVQPSKRNVLDDSAAAAAPTCAICLEEFDEGEKVCISRNKHCPHQYHMSCAFQWLMAHEECPCCRRDYLTSSRSINDGPSSPPPLLVTPTAPNEEDLEVESRAGYHDWRSLIYALNVVREDVGGLSAVAEDDCPTSEEDGEDDDDGGGDGGGD
jgi:Ring finger domain